MVNDHALKCPKCRHLFYITDKQAKAIMKEELAKSIKGAKKGKDLNLFAVIEETVKLVEKLAKRKIDLD